MSTIEYTLPDFNTLDLARAVERLDPAQVDRLEFGSVRVDADGAVVFYSKKEAALSGRGDRPVMGMQFFTAIAPCMNTPAFRGQIESALSRGTLDAEFLHIGDFEDRSRELRVRALSAADGGFWLFMQRG